MDVNNKQIGNLSSKKVRKQTVENDKLGLVFLSLLVIGIAFFYVGVSVKEFDKFEMIITKMLKPIISA